ncbi:MAG: transposase [Firmicutes bacterium]|nr:transposase [Bacillota bacterium]
MADFSADWETLVRKRGADPGFLRSTGEGLLQPWNGGGGPGADGAGRYDRTADRPATRNGSRPRDWATRLGTRHLAIPKLWQGRDFLGFWEPRKRREQALVSVIQEPYVPGVSIRQVDQRVQALGREGVSRSTVSRVAPDGEARVEAFRQRPLESRDPSGGLDAQYSKVREGDRGLRRALVVAIGVRETGERAGLGFHLGWSEDTACWTALLRRLRERGLIGVLLVIRDAHYALQQAIRTVFQGAAWQRCRVYCLRTPA